jgi:hypothetical protein
MRSRSLAVGIVTALVSAAPSARAEPSARFVYLRGAGTESCPSEADVRMAVQTRLGYDPFSSYAPATMFAEVSAAAPSGFTASLKLVDADNVVRGDRTLHVHGRCADLMDAMALTISIAIDPASITRTGPPADAPPQEKPVDPSLPEIAAATPPRADSPAPPPTLAPPPPPKLVFFAGAGPIASLGAAPAAALGGTVGVDGQRGRLFGGIEGRADLPASASAGTLGRVKSSLLAGSLLAGAREGPFYGVAVGSVGRVAATSEDVTTSRDRSAIYLAAGIRVGAAVPLGERFELRIRAEMLANLQRHTLTISDQPAYEFPVASGDLGATLAIRLP